MNAKEIVENESKWPQTPIQINPRRKEQIVGDDLVGKNICYTNLMTLLDFHGGKNDSQQSVLLTALHMCCGTHIITNQ